MATSIIQADYHELADAAGRFDHQATEVYELNLRVQRAVDALRQSGWLGRAADRFYAEVDEALLPTLRQLVSALDDAGRVSRQVSQMIEQAEQEAAGRFK
ncbi:MAG: WXG100 family type VII secretion target [Chloroflexota bacterium]